MRWPETETPAAGGTANGRRMGSGGELEQRSAYPALTFRSILSDEGYFIGLEPVGLRPCSCVQCTAEMLEAGQ